MPSLELTYAITHATLSRLQSLVQKLCDTSPTAKALVEEELLTASTPPTIDLTTEEPNEPRQTIQQLVSSETAKRQRYTMCKHCKQEFDVTSNTEDSCQYHEGSLEIDNEGDFWADWDEDCHGSIDSDLAEEYPEGFKWSCCDGTGEEEGCMIGPHVVDGGYKPEEVKRRRV
ncbi:hypothetical protein E4T48_06867 [Aureobasidium sp. EXF-10727]|nr:hypothetical protein E4T48_06867 [Aureobasidium sp. EXF-10727]